jgi:hypothetical protein
MCAHDLDGIVAAQRLKDPYGPRVRWLKIKNPSYSQDAGRRELFDRSRRPGGLAMTWSPFARCRRPRWLALPFWLRWPVSLPTVHRPCAFGLLRNRSGRGIAVRT